MKKSKIELYHDNFQNYKCYGIPKAQLVIADIPYNLAEKAYASSPMWYNGGDNANGESKLAKKSFFNSDGQFRLAEYMHFCSTMLKKEPKGNNEAPAMIVFCAFDQDAYLVDLAKRYGFHRCYPIFFVKNYSSQVLKANMKIVGATEHALVFYRDKLPKFRNGCRRDENGKPIRGTGKMIFDWFEWRRDSSAEYPRIHPTQKPVGVLKQLIQIFTDPGDVVIDPCAGSASTLRAAFETGRDSYGFEVDRKFYQMAQEQMIAPLLNHPEFEQIDLFDGEAST